MGNAPNIGDPFEDIQEDVTPLPQGRITVTIVDKPPRNVAVENPITSLKVMSACHETMGLLVEKIAKSYSPIHSEYYS